MHRLVLTLLISVSAPARAAEADGYAHGNDHCYRFSAPSGWVMDPRPLASNGIPMVFYPRGSTWNSANHAMYTRPLPRTMSTADPIQTAVDEVVAMYAASSQTVTAERLQVIRSLSGFEGEMWQFSGYSNGGFELVAYFPAHRTVNFFVAQVGGAAHLEEAKRALIELSASYREANDCRPCEESKVCGS